MALADVAAVIRTSPRVLRAPNLTVVSVVAVASPEGLWEPFAIRVEVGGAAPRKPDTITAGQLFLVRYSETSDSLPDADALVSLVNRWRETVPNPGAAKAFSDQAHSYWDSRLDQHRALPSWRVEIYATGNAPRSFQLPRGPFANTRKRFMAESPAEAAGQWFQDPTLTEHASVSSDQIQIRIWDHRARIESVSVDHGVVTVRAHSAVRRALTCHAVIRTTAEQPVRKSVRVRSGVAHIRLPGGAQSYDLRLFGSDNQRYDEFRGVVAASAGQVAGKNWLQSIADEAKPETAKIESEVEAAARRIVDPLRIEELRGLGGASFDTRRLVRICEELNAIYRAGAYLATAALTRVLMDHVPPVFSVQGFAQVAAHAKGCSLRRSLSRLEQSARDISDRHLHQPIRAQEALPTAAQVNFSHELDVLLEEVARLLRAGSPIAGK